MSVKIMFRRDPNYKQNKFCVLEFKGSFESDFDQESDKALAHLGDLTEVEPGKWNFQLGVLDIIGKEAPIEPPLYYIESQKNE